MRRLLLICLMALVALPGCATLKSLFAKSFKKPTLVFRTARLSQASLASATVDLVFELRNPNALGLSLAGVDYAFFVEGKQVVAGTPPRGLTIPAGGKAELVFPANVRFSDVAPVVETFLTKEFAHYRAQGHLGIKTPIGVVRIPLATEGDFEVPKLPSVQVGQPRIASLSFGGAMVEIPLSVTNRNSYALPINAITGALAIGGANVGSVSLGDLGDFSGKATREVMIPVNIDFRGAAAAANSLRSGSGSLALNGEVASGGIRIPLRLQQQVSFRR